MIFTSFNTQCNNILLGSRIIALNLNKGGVLFLFWFKHRLIKYQFKEIKDKQQEFFLAAQIRLFVKLIGLT